MEAGPPSVCGKVHHCRVTPVVVGHDTYCSLQLNPFFTSTLASKDWLYGSTIVAEIGRDFWKHLRNWLPPKQFVLHKEKNYRRVMCLWWWFVDNVFQCQIQSVRRNNVQTSLCEQRGELSDKSIDCVHFSMLPDSKNIPPVLSASTSARIFDVSALPNMHLSMRLLDKFAPEMLLPTMVQRACFGYITRRKKPWWHGQG